MKPICIILIIIILAVLGVGVWMLWPGEITKVPVKTGQVIFISPSEGEQWEAGKEYRISWKNAPQICAIDIERVSDGQLEYFAGGLETPLPQSGYVVWTLPLDYPAGTYRIAILAPAGGESGMAIVARSGVFSIINTEASETMEIKVYFNKLENGNIDCECDNLVIRMIPKTQAVARAALEELIKGPTQKERTMGYSACLPTEKTVKEYKEYYGMKWEDKIKINSIKIENQVAYVDFSQEINSYGGGSCWTGSIRRGITNTLKQFPSVDNVIISIEGETEDILQP